MHRPPFTRSFLLIFSGPIIWALHFLFIYGLNGVLCARPTLNPKWAGLHAAAWGTLAASLAAILLLAGILARTKLPESAEGSRGFVRWLSLTLGALSLVAIVWETLPVFFVAPCL